ncbi:MAG: glycerol-3-phosphate 1-O-acyltransferase PlsY [Weeping tea tree witches'-broom phytoplasma]|uniref:glycerol-3-phosphate 1-O-acyltransferase PlsY n=1 Tax=Candidatus Phytoplasma melaleucae TaxID=2982630 RepID=UPI00293B3B4C|nr:glycerol-3-phosphate 1-O-acyltransferase PlsY [Weeping tea tree witches'-broom phytoplasma]
MYKSDYLIYCIVYVLCYLVGAIPVGLWIGKYHRKDIRLLGSKNIGSSNVTRILGLKYGFLTFLLDFLKGFLPIFIVNNLNPNLNNWRTQRIFLGMFSILGQMFSIFNRFQGGKAIATSVGVVTGISPWIGLLGIILFIILVIICKYASLASLISTLLVNISLYIETKTSPCSNIQTIELIVIFLITILIFVKHYRNIINLLNKKENKLTFN